MKIGIPREIEPGETRVAAIPETVRGFIKDGWEVLVQAGAGEASLIADADFQASGAVIVDSAAELFTQADALLKVHPPPSQERAMLRRSQVLVCILAPQANAEAVLSLASSGVSSFSLDMIPRITRAQPMDVLSSMSTIAGYKAVMLAADALPKMCPMMMTAAGTIRPASALIIGAGVAGLQAVATARRLGAVPTAIDVRPAVKEQVESLGAKFIPMEVRHEAETTGGYAADLGEEFYKGEQEIIAPHSRHADMIISTALIPGRKAPVLITAAMVEQMHRGAVIIDLAAGAGGNCSLTRPDEIVEHNGVKIFGPRNLPAEVPVHASQMLARNFASFVRELRGQDGQLKIDTSDELISATLVTHDGQLVNPAVRKAMGMEKES